jgi:hypothetical protein
MTRHDEWRWQPAGNGLRRATREVVADVSDESDCLLGQARPTAPFTTLH